MDAGRSEGQVLSPLPMHEAPAAVERALRDVDAVALRARDGPALTGNTRRRSSSARHFYCLHGAEIVYPTRHQARRLDHELRLAGLHAHERCKCRSRAAPAPDARVMQTWRKLELSSNGDALTVELQLVLRAQARDAQRLQGRLGRRRRVAEGAGARSLERRTR